VRGGAGAGARLEDPEVEEDTDEAADVEVQLALPAGEVAEADEADGGVVGGAPGRPQGLGGEGVGGGVEGPAPPLDAAGHGAAEAGPVGDLADLRVVDVHPEVHPGQRRRGRPPPVEEGRGELPDEVVRQGGGEEGAGQGLGGRRGGRVRAEGEDAVAPEPPAVDRPVQLGGVRDGLEAGAGAGEGGGGGPGGEPRGRGRGRARGALPGAHGVQGALLRGHALVGAERGARGRGGRPGQRPRLDQQRRRRPRRGAQEQRGRGLGGLVRPGGRGLVEGEGHEARGRARGRPGRGRHGRRPPPSRDGRPPGVPGAEGRLRQPPGERQVPPRVQEQRLPRGHPRGVLAEDRGDFLVAVPGEREGEECGPRGRVRDGAEAGLLRGRVLGPAVGLVVRLALGGRGAGEARGRVPARPGPPHPVAAGEAPAALRAAGKGGTWGPAGPAGVRAGPGALAGGGGLTHWLLGSSRMAASMTRWRAKSTRQTTRGARTSARLDFHLRRSATPARRTRADTCASHVVVSAPGLPEDSSPARGAPAGGEGGGNSPCMVPYAIFVATRGIRAA